jgi:hypothetical protein
MVTNRIALVFAAAVALAAVDISPAPASSDRPASGDGRAQTLSPDGRAVRPVRTRVEIRPGRLIRRECVDDIREVWRPYWGYVVTPGMRCWWVRQ